MGEQQRREKLKAELPEGGLLEHSKKLWVVAVLAFWISAGITLVVMLVTGKLNLILVCVTLGMMVLGVWLKARYQLQQRRSKEQSSGDGQS